MTISPGDRPGENPRATRSVVMAKNGMVVTSQPLASTAGLQVLIEGGNAVDASVTAAATLSVVEPTMTGLGGDLFALLCNGRTDSVYALNASGRAPFGASLEALEDRFPKQRSMPHTGILSISVPGAIDGWEQLLKHHGTISLSRALAPAIEYARNGFVVTEVVANQWKASESLLLRDPTAASTFLPNGRAPKAGETFSNSKLATTLERLSSDGSETFYRGELAHEVSKDLSRRGSWFSETDFSSHRSDWVTPLRTMFRGREILELPPNTQGLTAIEILNILDEYDLESLGHNSPNYLHLFIEAVRIAFADRDAYVADSTAVDTEVIKYLCSKSYAASRRDEIELTRSASRVSAWRQDGPVPPPRVGSGDTVCLAAADSNGNVVSLIQSLFGAFGSGVMAGDTGIVLQNRASLFSIEPRHPNCLAPGKRSFHTLIPAVVLEKNKPLLAFGVMGGDMQAQGHAQVIANFLAFDMNIQEAGEAARARWTGEGVAVESGISSEARSGLSTRMHHLTNEIGGFGGFQGIEIDQVGGVLKGGSDPRKDGVAIGW